MTQQNSSRKHLARQRSSSRLAAKLDSNLFAYAVAASAAGVGMMALTSAAEAKVVATRAYIPIPINGGVVQFDINGDGQMDFGLSATHFGGCTSTSAKRGKAHRLLGCGGFGGKVEVSPAQAGNEVWGAASSWGRACAAALPAGEKIGAVRPFTTGDRVLGGFGGSSEGYYFCPWKGFHPPSPFLGVKFLDSDSQVHFGWVRITMAFGDEATITGYAYETVPNKAIAAGATDAPTAQLEHPADVLMPEAERSLGVLALGYPGMAAWRKREKEENIAA